MTDERLTTLNFFGREYPLCLTVLAQQQVQDEWGSLDALSELLTQTGAEAMTGWCQLLRILMEGGAARVKALAWMAGQESDELPPIPEIETLTKIIGWADIAAFGPVIMAAIGGSTQQTVEAAPEKNAETTQE